MAERLGYRPWTGERRRPRLGFWPITRSALGIVLRRRIFWFFLVLALLDFFLHSGVIYLMAQVEGATGFRLPPGFREKFLFTGTGDAYKNFIFFQSTVVMVMLALAGSFLVGDDFRARAIPFYLSKPVGKGGYFLGKLGAAGILTLSVTLVPTAILFIEYGAFTESIDYYLQNGRIFGAIVGYSALVSLVESVLVLGVAAVMKGTAPIAMTWGGVFVLLPAVSELVGEAYRWRGLSGDWAWRLLDVWRDMGAVATLLFGGKDETTDRWPWAAAALAVVVVLSLIAFARKVRAVEVVR